MFGWFRLRPKAAATEAEAAAPRRRLQLLGGRRYVTDATYLLPKDLKETDRLDFQHFMLRFLLRGNYAAPLRRPQSILDVGCGTNRWGIEVAQVFPEANVIGVDLVPTPTPTLTPPENYVFMAGDVLKGLEFADASFDFVHQRLLILALPSVDWRRAVAELVRVTRPGGWVELVESIGQVEFPGADNGTTALRRINEWNAAACQRRGIDLRLAGEIGEVLRAAGLKRVAQRPIPIPLGAHGGRVGTMMETNFFAVQAALKQPILMMKLASADDYDATVAAARAEVARNTAVFPYYVAFGQR